MLLLVGGHVPELPIPDTGDDGPVCSEAGAGIVWGRCVNRGSRIPGSPILVSHLPRGDEGP